MISGATRGAGGAALGSHLVSAFFNEAVQDGPARGLISETTEGRIAELTRLGSHARTATPLYHVHCDDPPDRPLTDGQRAAHWARVEQEFGFAGQPFSSTLHTKNGRTHEHRVYLRTRPNGTAIRLDHDYARREKLDRITEFEVGQPFVRGAHSRAVLSALENERPDVAVAVRAAGLHQGPRPRPAMTPTERQQQDRTGVSKADIANSVAAAWAHSDDGTAFAAALADHGLTLAQGDSASVIVDKTGNTHSVLRMLNMAAKASKTDAPNSAEVSSRLEGMNLPTVAEATGAMQVAQAAAAAVAHAVLGIDFAPATEQPAPAIAVEARPETLETVTPTQTAAPSIDAIGEAKDTAVNVTSGSGAALAASETGSAGASLEDAGDGPGEPPDVNASPDERAKWSAKDQAYRERKASIWAAWIASQEAARKQTAPTKTHTKGGQENVDIQRQAEESAEAIQRLINDLGKAYRRAASAAEIRRAVAIFEADSAAIHDRAEQHGDDRAAGGESSPTDWYDIGDPRIGGASSGDVSGLSDTENGRGTEQDRRDFDSPDRSRGKSATAGGIVRARIADAAAAVRIESRLNTQPDAMARLRAGTQALQPDPIAQVRGRTWFDAVSAARDGLHARYTEQRSRAPKTTAFDQWLEAQARIDPTARAVIAAVAEQKEKKAAAVARVSDDRNRIVAILATHPHPDPADRDPDARERREVQAARDEHTASRAAEAAETLVAAKAAFWDRDAATWMRNVLFGQPTAKQRQALDAAAYAERNANTRPDDGTLKVARERGRLLAIGARDRTTDWKQRPDVVKAFEQDRLNRVVDAAAASGDPAITQSLRDPDPDAARQVILLREESERRQQEAMERRLRIQPRDDTPRPGPRSPR